jgi:sialidase-1
MDSGRLLVPVWMSTGTGGHAHRLSIVSVIYSDDHGMTWLRGDVVVRNSDAHPNPSETVALQLAGGRVALNIRNESYRHRRLISYSADGVTCWSEPTFHDELYEPVCFASLIRMTRQPEHGRNRVLFANPDSRSETTGSTDVRIRRRENLVLRLSYDEGETWPVAKVLDPGISGYSDLALGPNGTIYCLYEEGGVGGDMFHNAQMAVMRLNLEWLTDGADTYS